MARLVISTNERIMLHLLELDRYRDDAEVPMGASQEGIAQKLQAQVHNVSRTLSSLQAEGLVTDRLAHVRGAPRRRRAYFLTERGRQAAQTLRTDLGKRKAVIEHEGKALEMPLDEAARKIEGLAGVSLSFSEVVDLARAAEVLSVSDVAKVRAEPVVRRESVLRAHGRPKVESFFGRESELRALSDAMSNPSMSTVLIWGIPGIGKSTLASRLFESLSGKRSVFWYSFREWDTEALFLTALADFLGSSGRTLTAAAQKHSVQPGELYAPILADLTGLDCVLFLDDVHKVTGQLLHLLSMVVESAKASKSAKMVLISRALPSFLSKSDSSNLVLEVSGLDRDSAWRMAQSMNAEDTMEVVEESHGNPFLLSMMARTARGRRKGDVAAFIEREVFSTLSDQGRRALEQLSVYRHPVKLDALEGVDYEAVAELRHLALVVEQDDGIWAHDLVRDFLTSHFTAEAKIATHHKAGTYCVGQSGAEWMLEALHHFALAGEWDAAGRIALASAPDLAREFPSETLGLVLRMPLDTMPSRERAELLFFRGQLNESAGNLELGLNDYEECLSLVGGESERRALVLEAVARLQSQVERWTESISAHETALHLHEKAGDKEGQAREWMSIGGVLRKKGEFAKARDAYSKALSFSTMEENRPAQAACLNNLALLDWDEGRLRDAEARFKESIRLAHVVRDHAGEARGLENLASLFRDELKLAEVSNILLESAEAYRRAGELAEFKRMQAACAESLGDQGRYSQAIELCEAALRRPELRKRKSLFQRIPEPDFGDIALESSLVDLLRSSGDLKGASKELGRFESIANASGDQNLMARAKLMAAMVSEDSGDLEAALRHLDTAESLLRTSGNSEGLIAVYMRRGVIEEKRGEDAAAVASYREAARHAELAGNRHALGLAKDNIASLGGG